MLLFCNYCTFIFESIALFGHFYCTSNCFTTYSCAEHERRLSNILPNAELRFEK